MCSTTKVNRDSVTDAVKEAHSKGEPITGRDLDACATMIRRFMGLDQHCQHSILQTLKELQRDFIVTYDSPTHTLLPMEAGKRDLFAQSAKKRALRERKQLKQEKFIARGRRDSKKQRQLAMSA